MADSRPSWVYIVLLLPSAVVFAQRCAAGDHYGQVAPGTKECKLAALLAALLLARSRLDSFGEHVSTRRRDGTSMREKPLSEWSSVRRRTLAV